MFRISFVLCSLAALSGCQTVQETGSSSPYAETTLSETDVGLDESALYDPLAIVGELGEAEDSPRLQPGHSDSSPAVLSETELTSFDRSIWGEISRQFALPQIRDSKYAELHRKRLTHADGFFSEFLAKSEVYLPYVWQEVQRRGLPAEIALLPYVESAYSPWAVSPMGAVGMWQIMPGTARVLDLDLGQTCDQRRDIVHSTRAALDYLQQMHAKFDDWLLAIAAYNAGPGRIDRAIRENKRAGKPTDFWSLRLPRETRRYVPRLLVTRDLILDAKSNNIALPNISSDIGFKTVSLEAPMEVSLVQELSGLPLADIRKYNPCIRSWITPAQTPYQLVLPASHVQSFATKLVSVSVRDYVRTRPYKVQTGDTLSEIAARTGASVTELMMLNGMQNARIVAGRTIRVPSTSENITRQLARMELGNAYGETMRYRVRAGDSLWKIAQRFRTTVTAIRKLNSTSNLIRPGEYLTVPVN